MPAAHDTTYYYVVAEGACGKDTLGPARIILNDTVEIEPHLSGENSYCQGQSADALSVVAKGDGLQYQWYVWPAGAATGNPIAGATSSSYTPDTSTPGEYDYYVEVSGICGAAQISDKVKITVKEIPDKPVLDIEHAISCHPDSTNGFVRFLNYSSTGTYTFDPDPGLQASADGITGYSIDPTTHIYSGSVRLILDGCPSDTAMFTVNEYGKDCDGDGVIIGGGPPEDPDDNDPCNPIQTAAPVIDTPIAGDNMINNDEYENGITVTGTADVGAKITIKWNSKPGSEKTTTADASGNWSITFTKTDMPEDGNDTLIAQAEHHNCEAEAKYPLVIGSKLPDIENDKVTDDNIVNKEEIDKVVLNGTTSGVEEGQTVTIKLTDVNGNEITLTTTVTDVDAGGNGKWATDPEDLSGLADGDVTFKSYVTDKVGNPAADTTTFLIDTSIEPPIIKTPSNGTAIISPPPGEEDVNKVTIDYVDEDGNDKKIIVSKGDDGTWTIDNPEDNPGVTIDPTTGVVTIPADQVEDGSKVTAIATDGGRNTSDEAIGIVALPEAPQVVIIDDSDDDGYLKKDEVEGKTEISVTIFAPETAQVGDTLRITNPDGSKLEVQLTNEILADGVTMTYPKPLEDGDEIEVFATLQYAGGFESGPANDLAVLNTIPGVEIPEIFTPDGNGLNDKFKIKGLRKYPNNSIIIMNRWGNKVFEAAPYNNDWSGESQFGISVGSNQLPEGTYFYILKLKKNEVKKGYIYLKR